MEGDHPLWDGVSRPYSETIRAFLIYFQNEVTLADTEKHVFAGFMFDNFQLLDFL